MARLRLQTLSGVQHVELARRSTIGRRPDCDVPLSDRIVSKEHSLVLQDDSGWWVEDLGSLNGTYINGERITRRTPLRDGDELCFGATRARFELREPLSTVLPPAAGVAKTPTAPPLDSGSRAIRAATGQTIIASELPASAGFAPAASARGPRQRLEADYERLRLAHLLTRRIGVERDLLRLLEHLLQSLFDAVRADRGAVFLLDDNGQLEPKVSLTHDGDRVSVPVSQTLLGHVVEQRSAILTHDAALDFGSAQQQQSLIVNRISSAIVAPLVHDDELLGVLWLDSATASRFTRSDLQLVTTIAGQAATVMQIQSLSRQVEAEAARRERFRRLLSPNLAERVLSGEMVVERGGQRIDPCTVFNSDIRGFTALSQNADPESVVAMLNGYFEAMVEVIFAAEGTLDKFMGDGILALFGAPRPQPDDATRAVGCALEQMRALGQYNAARRETAEPPLEIGIGIHSGPVVAGYVGSPQALSYTVIGDTANVSARLCDSAEPDQVVISEATRQLLEPGTFEMCPLTPLTLRGDRRKVERHAVLGRR